MTKAGVLVGHHKTCDHKIHGHSEAHVRAWAGCAQAREFLEKHYEEAAGTAAVKLAIRALMETVEASSKSFEIAVMEREAGEGPPALSLRVAARGLLLGVSCCCIYQQSIQRVAASHASQHARTRACGFWFATCWVGRFHGG